MGTKAPPPRIPTASDWRGLADRTAEAAQARADLWEKLATQAHENAEKFKVLWEAEKARKEKVEGITGALLERFARVRSAIRQWGRDCPCTCNACQGLQQALSNSGGEDAS